MSLKATLTKAVNGAFVAIGDIPKRCTFHSVSGTPVRDIETGTSVLPKTDYILPKVVFAKFTETEPDKPGGLIQTGTKIIFPSQDLPVAPKATDTLTDPAGVKWEIVKRLSDPASLVCICQVRTS